MTNDDRAGGARPDGGTVDPAEYAREAGFAARVRANPEPALRWLAVAAALAVVEVGALCSLLGTALPVDVGLAALGDALPTLLSRETIPNQGIHVPGEGWQGTFLGLSPAAAWGLRVALIYAYATAWVWVLWRGVRTYRREYRIADWTPRDDVFRRFGRHRWGQFGLVVVLAFVVMAVFAPALGPTTMERNSYDPYSYTIETYDDDLGEVQELTVGDANLASVSQGTTDRNVGFAEYDEFGRFHPFGTLPSGQDLFTFVAAGARVSLFISLLAIGLSAVVSATLAVASAYYGGLVDLAVVLLSDATQALPQLLVVMLLSVVLSETWLASLYSGGVLLALIFALTGWPSLWRAVRGPALQVAERGWVDAADSIGLASSVTMRRHMLPYILGYLLVYVSMSLGGIIIGIAGLSFLGLGVTSPTPEWGRIVDIGQPYLATVSWHIAFVPGVLVVIVVTGFNALGDGIRDAIDPESEGGEGEAATAASGAGG
ncbi:ABC transporter permease [Halorussus halobius]|uniref:ABC transporter permease n=1 Tax=Halorussus halobius TaxID=1710537 RepID=UPI001091C191|nr:ABC transporter permease [Halorussus halobius]